MLKNLSKHLARDTFAYMLHNLIYIHLPTRFRQNVQAKPLIAAFEKLAQESSLAQGLQHMLTTFKKVVDSPHQILYLLWDAGFNL